MKELRHTPGKRIAPTQYQRNTEVKMYTMKSSASIGIYYNNFSDSAPCIGIV